MNRAEPSEKDLILAREWLMQNVYARDFCYEGTLEPEDIESLAQLLAEVRAADNS